jgi:hypothetical protein
MGNRIGVNAGVGRTHRDDDAQNQPATPDDNAGRVTTTATHPTLRSRVRDDTPSAASTRQEPTDRGDPNPQTRVPTQRRIMSPANAVRLASLGAFLYVAKNELLNPTLTADLRNLPTFIKPHALDTQPECYPDCLGGLVNRGESNVDAVTSITQDTLHQFRQSMLSESDPNKDSPQLIFHDEPSSRLRTGQLAYVDANEKTIPRRVFVAPVEIAHPNLNPMATTRSDDTFRAILYHELAHAHTSNEFFAAVEEHVQASSSKAGNQQKLKAVIVESLTLGLQHEVAPEMDQAYGQNTNLVRTKLGMQASVNQLGSHVIEHLGLDTVRDAVIGGNTDAIEKVLSYFEELQLASFAKRL